MSAKNACARVLLASGLVAMWGCSSLKYSVDHDPKADFARLRTFSWMEPAERAGPNAVVEDPLLDAQIRTSIEAELAAKGLTKVDAPAGDILVGYQAALRRDLEVDKVAEGYAYRPVGWAAWPYQRAAASSAASVSGDELKLIRKGSLVVQMAAGNPRTIVWRGVAEGDLPEQPMNNKDRDAKVRKGIRELLDGFPPKPQ